MYEALHHPCTHYAFNTIVITRDPSAKHVKCQLSHDAEIWNVYGMKMSSEFDDNYQTSTYILFELGKNVQLIIVRGTLNR
jgi:predicted double-glycine peptidase